ncbi:MAG: 2-hydroxyacid dehydrogenase [Candidatus Eisenbacteria bacterium]|nr:2-hydroxyacid dehydrogenase [Candidatus Eisenbacteria bacterium]
MAKKPVVLCMDLLPSAMRELIVGQKPEGLDLVFVETSSQEEQVAKARDADYILCSWTPVPGQVIEAGEKLKLIQKYGIGVDKIDMKTAAQKGIPVCICAGVNAVAVAETAITLMLAVYKQLCVAHNSLRAGHWLKWELRTACYELWQKTVGIIGGGNIGRAVAKRLSHGFECRVLYYDVLRLPQETETAMGMIYASMEDLLRQADIVSLHIPLLPETRGLIGAKAFALIKPTAVLINTARGGVVDEPALIEALQKKTIAGAGLDVFAKEPPDPDNPLLRMDNVVVTPHNGGGTVDTAKRIVSHAFDNIMRVERGEPLPEADRVRST